MKAIDAYNNTAQRAKRFLLLHDGLINTRSRRIRKDWKAGFVKLMHWPKASEIERIDSKDAIIILRDGAALKPAHFSAGDLDDLLRASLSFGVSALDRYVHERVVKGVIAALKVSNLTSQQKDLSIPARAAMQISKDALTAVKRGKTFRPANIVRHQIQDALHKRPFQSYREIEYAFNLLGVTNLNGQLQARYGIGDMKPIRNQLNQIAHRRNLVVHEGDLERHKRGGRVVKHSIARKYVEDSLTFLDTFVNHLDHVA